jgi:PKD repeat protein
MPTSDFAITPTPPISIQVQAGQDGVFSFTVVSLAGPDRRIEIVPRAFLVDKDGKGEEVDWLIAGPTPTLSMCGGQTTDVTITVKPKLTSPSGKHTIKLVIAEKDRPNDVYAESSPVFCEVVARSQPIPPPRRRWWWIPVIAGGLLLLAGGGVFVWWLIKPPPVAAASAEPLSGRIPLTVSFHDASTGKPSQIAWNFGDGSSISRDSNPSHTFEKPATYTVELTVKDRRGRASTAQLTVKAEPPAPPTAAASGKPLSGRVPLTVKFQSESTARPSRVEWRFGDGSPVSTEHNPTHIYRTPGTYTVALRIEDSYGGSSTAQLTVRAERPEGPVAAAWGTPLTGRIPLTVMFQNRSTGNPSRVQWSFGDGSATSTESNPRHIYQRPGTYAVTLTAWDTYGTSSTARLTVTAEPPPAPPVARFQPSATVGKWPLQVTFTNTSQNAIAGTQWMWSFGNGATSSGQSPTYRFEDPGDYKVRLKISNANGSSATETVIRVQSRRGEPVPQGIGPFGGGWGNWAGGFHRCPEATLAYGFEDKVEPSQGGGDDTALNGIKLWCVSLPDLQSNHYVTSEYGQWGTWSERMDCKDRTSYLVGARLRIEPSQGGGDDTGGVDVELSCSNGAILSNGGHGWGTWRDWSYCPANTAICGIKTRIEPPRGSGDDTALNDVQLQCCYVK